MRNALTFSFFRTLILIVLLLPLFSKSQSCNSCTINVSANDSLTFRVTKSDTTSYIVNTGQTLCIYPTGTAKGNITLNGGTVCNKGRFFPNTLNFNSGTLNLSGTVKLKSSLTVNSSNTINVSQSCVLNVSGNLNLSGGTITNEGMINVDGTLTNGSGILINKAIINCNSMGGSNTVNNNGLGIINTKN